MDILADQSSVSMFLRNTTTQIVDLIDDASVQSKSTMNIQNLNWPAELDRVTFRLNTRSVTVADCNEQLIAKCNKLGINLEFGTPTTVLIRMYNLTWLFKNKRDFVDLVKLSQKTKNEDIYATDLYVNLVEHFWDQYYYKLFKY